MKLSLKRLINARFLSVFFNKIIVELLNNKNNLSQEKEIKTICSSLYKKGAKAVLLACTDLQIVTSKIHLAIPIIDTTQVLINASIRELLD